MAYLNLNTLLLLALAVLLPTASLAQSVGVGVDDVDDAVELQVEGDVICSATGNPVEGGPNAGSADAGVSLICGKMGAAVAVGVTDEKGHYHLSAQVKAEVGELVKGNECGVRVKLPVPSCTALNHQGALYAPARILHTAASDKVLCLAVNLFTLIL
ncbi:hypothetical protein QN277_013450 [Acacia crassicarpa]|uniref:Uncharacterized protein n=1 Tax=Acacia crassicarpa TaxID=499986 RepID=A0AAE1N2F5_9FABA|nr:hypothetical protein QN277_013450 [Acacia crassicarpa]